MTLVRHVSELLAATHGQRQAFSRAQDLVRDRLAPDFTPFQFIDDRETTLSEILAALLDPAGTHGQGSRFLTAFLSWLGPPWSALAAGRVVVRTEVAIADMRRIDILLHGPGWTLAIENKPWAADQLGQVADYPAYLDRGGGQHALLYPSGDGSGPSEGSIRQAEREAREAKGELLVRSYPRLVPWLEACKSLCRADRVAAFIDQFVHHIRREFEGMRDTTERRLIVDAIIRSPDELGAAMEIALAWPDVKKRRLEELGAQVKAICAQEHPEWTVELGLLRSSYPSVFIGFPEATDHRFGLAFESAKGALDGCFWGVAAKLPGPAPDLTAHDRIAARLGGNGKATRHWPWWQWVDSRDEALGGATNWETSSTPWIMIGDGRLARGIVGTAGRVRSALVACSHAAPAAGTAGVSAPAVQG